MPRLQLEGDILHREALALGSTASCALDHQRGLRSRKLERADLGPVILEGRAKPRPALARADEALPVGDGEFDRSERPGHQDRGGDHDAARRLVVDDEVGADAKHAGLQRHAHHLGEGTEPARHVRGLLLMREVLPVGLPPHLTDASCHAHGMHDLGVAARALADAITLRCCLDRRLGGLAGQDVGCDGETNEDQGTAHRDPPEQRVEREADEEIERDPRQVEQRRRAAAGEEGADLVEVAQRLLPITLRLPTQRGGNLEAEDALAQVLVDRGADAGEDAAAEHVEQALEEEQGEDDGREADQGRNAAARQHPVVDLHHVEGTGEVEDVDQAAEQGDPEQGAAAGSDEADAPLGG